MATNRAKVNSLLQELNTVRNLIIGLIEKHTSLYGLISEFENHFLAYVLLPSYQLQQIIQMRKYLEQEYTRISRAMEEGLFTDPEQIKTEVRQAMKHADAAFACPQPDLESDKFQPMGSMDVPDNESDYEIDAAKKDKLVKEFRKVVLPKVHSDTSDAPFEVFNTVYEAYKKKDYLLMAAFIIQYREDSPAPGEDATDFGHLGPPRLREYRSVLDGLQKRVHRLENDPTAQRLENREQVLAQMKKQNMGIRKSANEEAERVLFFRSCLEDLVQMGSLKTGAN